MSIANVDPSRQTEIPLQLPQVDISGQVVDEKISAGQLGSGPDL